MRKKAILLQVMLLPLCFGCDSPFCVPSEPDRQPTFVNVGIDENGELVFENECDSRIDYKDNCFYYTIEWCCADYIATNGILYDDVHVELEFKNCWYRWRLNDEDIGFGLCDYSCRSEESYE